MATAAATADAAPAGKGKKKLVIILVAVLLLVAVGGGAAVFMMKKKAAAEDGEGESPAAPAAVHKSSKDASHPPTYVALDPFVVNLADKETEKYAQIGITLEVDDPKFAEQMKGYMPSIRNAILLILAHKTSGELLSREGKTLLAAEIQRESVRPMGIEIDSEDAEDAPEEPAKKTAGKKKKKKVAVHNPVTSVNFSNFIVQ